MNEERPLGELLWELMQAPQGYAFISDDVSGMSDEDTLVRAEAALAWERECVSKLRGFVRRARQRLTEKQVDAIIAEVRK